MGEFKVGVSAEPLVSCLQFMVEDRMACGTSGAVKYSTRWVIFLVKFWLKNWTNPVDNFLEKSILNRIG